MQAARQLAELLEPGRELVDRERRAAASGSATRARMRPRREQHRGEPLLRAVVEVALDALPLGVGDLDEAGARRAQLALGASRGR